MSASYRILDKFGSLIWLPGLDSPIHLTMRRPLLRLLRRDLKIYASYLAAYQLYP